MALDFEKYRFRQTALNDDEFNKRWRPIDARLNELEKLGFTFEQSQNQLIAEALKRISEDIKPVVEAVQAFANMGDLLNARAETEATVASGPQTFVVVEDERSAFAAPLYLIISQEDDPTVWMAGQTISYDNETGELVVDISRTRGAGTFTDWKISVASIPPETPPAQDAADITLSGVPGITAINVRDAFEEQQGDIENLSSAIGGIADTFAPIVSPGLQGEPTAPTPMASSNSTRLATTEFVVGRIAALLGSAPAALDTLNELAAALGNDQNFAATMTTALATKAADNAVVKLALTNQSFTGGVRTPGKAMGAIGSGTTFTPDPGNGPAQYATAAASFTLAANTSGASNGSLMLLLTVSASITVTLSGWTKSEGDALGATGGYLLYAYFVDATRYLFIKKVS